MSLEDSHADNSCMNRRPKFCIQAFLFAIVLFAVGTLSLQAVEIRLNGEVLSVMEDGQIHSYTTPMELYDGKPGVPLNALYPWMDSVYAIQIESEENSFQWKSDSPAPPLWNDLYIVETEEGRDVRVKDKVVLSNPERFVVLGIRLAVPTLRIWSMSEDPALEIRIRGELSPQKIKIEWKNIRYPEKLMEDSSLEALPHLLLTDDLTVIRFPEMMVSYFPLFIGASRWQTSDSSLEKPILSQSLAVDAASPQAPFSRFLSDDPMFFDSAGKLPAGFSNFLKDGIEAGEKDIIFSEDPEKVLHSGEAGSMVMFSNPLGKSFLEDAEKSSLQTGTISPPPNYVNVARILYAAVPAGLSASDSKIAFLSMDRLLRYQIYEDQDAVPLPLDPRVLRFFDAYRRVGRLVISGQITPNQGTELIQSYLDESENDLDADEK